MISRYRQVVIKAVLFQNPNIDPSAVDEINIEDLYAFMLAERNAKDHKQGQKEAANSKK
ncbi:conserved hypothetical protein [Ricinus communis]|uniref:Uncharacterized protein n=1 Tax=Ricinus communis TaxID=3988 RepID=B9SWV8_RICCO|nr:conserved hypothetical protein [Ricinus communis]